MLWAWNGSQWCTKMPLCGNQAVAPRYSVLENALRLAPVTGELLKVRDQMLEFYRSYFRIHRSDLAREKLEFESFSSSQGGADKPTTGLLDVDRISEIRTLLQQPNAKLPADVPVLAQILFLCSNTSRDRIRDEHASRTGGPFIPIKVKGTPMSFFTDRHSLKRS